MKDDDNDQVSHLLRSLAPAERDPLFRIRVLERRERRQFVRHVALLVGGGRSPRLLTRSQSPRRERVTLLGAWGLPSQPSWLQ